VDRTLPDADRRYLWALILAGSALSLLVCVSIARQKFFVGSDDGGWVYPYFWSFAPGALVVWAIACAGVFALLAIPQRFTERHRRLTVAAWIVLGIAVQALLRSLAHFTFEQLFTSDGANSFYSPTRHHGTLALITGFTELRATLPLHAQSNMPGKLIFVSLLGHLSARPAIMACVVVLLSALGAIPLYLFVRDLFGDFRAALFSVILYMFVPGKLFFFPLLNTITPVLALLMLYLVNRWLTSHGVASAVLLGLAMYAIAFFEPLPLVLGLLVIALAIRALANGSITLTTLAYGAIVGLVAFGAVLLVFRVFAHFDLITTFRAVQADAAAFNATTHRPYGIWVGANLVEFAFGTGLAQSVVFCGVLLAVAVRAMGSPGLLREPFPVLCLGLAAVLGAIDLLGVNRGEVTRLWIFLACLFQIPTAYACTRLGQRSALALVLATTLLQSALGTAMIAFVLP
jgi:methylthioxylose transferase